jgi:hypothetical protein
MNRITIVAVFLVFFAPVIVAVLMHSDWFEWRPAETRNHGELLQPPHPLKTFTLADQEGEPFERSDLLDQWQLLHVIDNACDESCLESLYWLRQVRRSQDRHQLEVDILLVTPAAISPETRSEIDALEADIRIIAESAGRALLDLLPAEDSKPVSYILDPGANIILRYPEGTDYNGMRRDLRRLLTWTRTDQPSSTRTQPDL